MKINLEGRKVFLTGAGRGIGKKIKEVFEAEGAVVISPSREELDLKKTESVSEYFKGHSADDYDIFIHCAGKNELAGITEIQEIQLQEIFQVNCFSAISILQHIVEGMKKRGNGRVIFISSLYAIVSKERRIAYSASKNALTGITKTLALELAKDQIAVNAIAPGYVMTDMTRKNLSEAEISDIRSRIPMGRFQSEEDIAYLAAFLCSDLNKNITGQLIAVDGGFLCR